MLNSFGLKLICFSMFVCLLGVVPGLAAYRVEIEPAVPGQEVDEISKLELYLVENIALTGGRTRIDSLVPGGRERVEFDEQNIPPGLLELRVEQSSGAWVRRLDQAEMQEKLIKIKSYPTGAASADLKIKKREIVLRPGAEKFIIQERIIVKNSSEKLFIPEDNFFELSLPEAANEFKLGPGFFSGEDVNCEQEKIVYRLALPPGQTELGFTYTVASTGSSGELNWNLQQPTTGLSLLLPAYQGLEVETGENLSRAETDDPNSYFFTADRLAAGEKISLAWSGLEEDSTFDSGAISQREARGGEYWFYRFMFWTAAIMLTSGIILLAVVAWWMLKKYSEEERDKEFIEKELEELEEAYRDGLIKKEYYRQTRSRWLNFRGGR